MNESKPPILDYETQPEPEGYRRAIVVLWLSGTYLATTTLLMVLMVILGEG